MEMNAGVLPAEHPTAIQIRTISLYWKDSLQYILCLLIFRKTVVHLVFEFCTFSLTPVFKTHSVSAVISKYHLL